MPTTKAKESRTGRCCADHPNYLLMAEMKVDPALGRIDLAQILRGGAADEKQESEGAKPSDCPAQKNRPGPYLTGAIELVDSTGVEPAAFGFIDLPLKRPMETAARPIMLRTLEGIKYKAHSHSSICCLTFRRRRVGHRRFRCIGGFVRDHQSRLFRQPSGTNSHPSPRCSGRKAGSRDKVGRYCGGSAGLQMAVQGRLRVRLASAS